MNPDADNPVRLGAAAKRLRWKDADNPYTPDSADFHLWRFGFISEQMRMDLEQATVVVKDCADVLGRIANEIEQRRGK